MKKLIRARVPGKLMLAGEYAVLEGKRALAVCVDQWLTATVSVRSDDRLVARSQLWPCERTIDAWRENDPSSEPLVHAIAAACCQFGLTGLDIAIDSELDVRAGLGSSSALRLAVAATLTAWSQGRAEAEKKAAASAYAWQTAAQGLASGYDIATQSTGGVVLFTPPPAHSIWPGPTSKLGPKALDSLATMVRVFVGGKGAPTGPQTQKTKAWLAAEQRMGALVELSEQLVSAWSETLCEAAPLDALCALIGAHRRILQDAPGQPTALLAELAALPACDQTWSYKTTGAGGEDALLVIGSPAARAPAEAALMARGWVPLAATFTNSGPQWLAEEPRADATRNVSGLGPCWTEAFANA